MKMMVETEKEWNKEYRNNKWSKHIVHGCLDDKDGLGHTTKGKKNRKSVTQNHPIK